MLPKPRDNGTVLCAKMKITYCQIIQAAHKTWDWYVFTVAWFPARFLNTAKGHRATAFGEFWESLSTWCCYSNIPFIVLCQHAVPKKLLLINPAHLNQSSKDCDSRLNSISYRIFISLFFVAGFCILNRKASRKSLLRSDCYCHIMFHAVYRLMHNWFYKVKQNLDRYPQSLFTQYQQAHQKF